MECSLSLFAVIIVGLTSLVYLFFKSKFSYWANRGVKQLEPRIPVGNLLQKHFRTIIGNIYAVKDGSAFVGGYFFTKPVVVATDLDFVQDILIRDFNNFHARGEYNNEEVEPITAHMFSLDGPKWKSLRVKFSPTFSSGKLKFMFPTIVEVSQRFREALDELLCADNVQDVKDLSARFTTDVIGSCAFGIECNSLKDPDNEFRKYGRMAFQLKIGILTRALMMLFPAAAKIFRLKVFQEDMTEFFMRIVRETVEYRQTNKIKRNDFMNSLIELMNTSTRDSDTNTELEKLTLEQATAQAFLFFIAGFETSSTTMMFTLYELALNQDIQEKARKEIEEILKKYEGDLSYEAVKEMAYVDQIINEALRKYTPVVALTRKAVDDYKVRSSHVTIEKGTTILIPAYAIHHDPKYYLDPEKFDPDRFTPDQIKNRHPMTFLGFGDGPRNCIGLRFGTMQTQIGLITLLKNYRFEVCSKTQIPMKFSETNPILSPEDGLHLKIEKL